MANLERQVLVCYDVTNTRARNKLFDALKGVGLMPIQASVFWGFLRRAEERQVQREFDRLLDPDTDRALLVPVRMPPEKQLGYPANAFDPPARSRVL